MGPVEEKVTVLVAGPFTTAPYGSVITISASEAAGPLAARWAELVNTDMPAGPVVAAKPSTDG